jgi:hypothetical protein
MLPSGGVDPRTMNLVNALLRVVDA